MWHILPSKWRQAWLDDAEQLEGQVVRRCVLTISCRNALATLLFREAQQTSPWLDLQVQFLSSVANTRIRAGDSDTRLDAYGHCPRGFHFLLPCVWVGRKERGAWKEETWFLSLGLSVGKIERRRRTILEDQNLRQCLRKVFPAI